MLTASWLLLLCGPVRAEEEHGPLTEEDRADLAFVASLGIPSVKDKPYVRLRAARMDARGVLRVKEGYGFLLEEHEDGRFDVLGEDLQVRTWTRSPPGTPPQRRVDYETRGLRAEMEALIGAMKELRAAGGNARAALWTRPGPRLRERATVVGMASACAQQGLLDSAHALLEEARAMPATRPDERIGGPLREMLIDEFATPRLWSHVSACGDPRVSRAELLRRFEAFLEHFPTSPAHADTAEEAARVLETMVAEDDVHATSVKPFEDLTRREQVAELIYQLRDQNGSQRSDPGTPSIWVSADGTTTEDTPAHKLKALGFDAVPQLIEALTDRRFTRTVGWWRRHTYSHYVVRVGHAASEILSAIAGCRLGLGVYGAKLPHSFERAEAAQRDARAWWAEQRKKIRQPAVSNDAPRDE